MDNKYSHIGHDKKNFVQNMFDKISPKYDFFNHLTTFYIDKYWRNRFIKKLHIQNGKTILDVACGTGDVCFEILKNNSVSIIGLDLSQNMINLAKNKADKKNQNDITFLKGDAENLPFDSNSIDYLTIAYGFRNISNYEIQNRKI